MKARKLTKSDPKAFQLSLRIRHPSMDPAELSRELRIEPEHSFRAGEPRPVRSGSAAGSVHADSYWLGALDPAQWPPDVSSSDDQQMQTVTEQFQRMATNSLGGALSRSATQFFRRHAELLHRLQSEGGQISLLVAFSAGAVGSFSLAPEVSRALADHAVTVDFEIIDE